MLDGSGAAIPPIAADRRILVVGAHQDAAVATGYLNPYRALLADLVVVAMAEDEVDHGGLAAALRELTRPGVPIVRAVLRPRPLGDVARPPDRLLRHGSGRAARPRSPRISQRRYGADGRARLRQPRATAQRSATSSTHLDADVAVVEVKAAAIDVVAEEAARLGIPVVLAANDVVPLAGEPDLDVELERLATEAISERRRSAYERAPLSGTAAARRRRGPAVVEGADGAGTRGDRFGSDSSL